jgi:hypothetical protein
VRCADEYSDLAKRDLLASRTAEVEHSFPAVGKFDRASELAEDVKRGGRFCGSCRTLSYLWRGSMLAARTDSLVAGHAVQIVSRASECASSPEVEITRH